MLRVFAVRLSTRVCQSTFFRRLQLALSAAVSFLLAHYHEPDPGPGEVDLSAWAQL
jgi:hypothetical protein